MATSGDPPGNKQTALSLSDRGLGWVLGQVIFLALIFLVPPNLGGLPAWPEPIHTVSILAGLLIGAAGLGLGLVAALYLGSNLTIFPHPKQDGSLVQGGLYGIVRHPIYAGVLLCALGWSLFRTSLPGLVLTLILGIFFDRKARREEKWLAEKFAEYGAYQKRVRKLIPWIY